MDDQSVDEAIADLYREGKLERRINPETGEEEYRLTDAGWAEASALVQELTRPETPGEEYTRLWGWDADA